jgi:hypothetical protein
MSKCFAICGGLLVLAVGPILGDTLTPPTQAVYSSSDNTHLFLVQPGVFEDSKQTRPCSGTLFRIDREKVAGFVSPRYVPVWTTILENALSPIGALVADDGSFVITVNDYSANTDEKTAVVIYGSQGKKIAALALADIFTPEAIATIPETTSSLLWFFGGNLDSKGSVLELTVWGGGTLGKPTFRKVRINLETGQMLAD